MPSVKRIILGVVLSLLLAVIAGAGVFAPEITKLLFPERLEKSLSSVENLGENLDVSTEAKELLPLLEIPDVSHIPLGKQISLCVPGGIPYAIGTIDPEFGVSRKRFAEAVKEAENLWEIAAGKDIFTPSVSANRMHINLVFDERQAVTTELKRRLSGIASAEGKFEEMKREHQRLILRIASMSKEIDSLKNRHSLMKKDLSVAIELYENKRRTYEAKVIYWNNQGGAPVSEYERLTREKSEIDILLNQIRTKEGQFNALGKEINGKVSSYNDLVSQINTVAGMINRLADSLNIDMALYNRIVADRGEFVTGIYKKEESKKSIYIYQFYDDRDLALILAHEMGHALGLPHGKSENSIMYPKIRSQELKLSPEDRVLLKETCK